MTQCEVRRKVQEDTQRAFGRLDVLVMNHGLVTTAPLAELSQAEFDFTFNINLKSFVVLIKAAVPYLEKTKSSIVCVSSIYSTLCRVGLLPYFLSKAAMDHMVRCLALEPKQMFEAVTPLSDRHSTVHEPIDAIAFLVSEEARYITDQCLIVDGGLSLKGNPRNWPPLKSSL
ncbi:3-oxoacyl-[acyl-carrier-protein] reductase FabG [Elysia marginata]|uniref:3-oxoacyl-[acyl-carrier-protein] reductase FabG n=1 Tax=Elysia marginata TaxID=1093978 RepID=A0AAV4I2E9_9GAST|nr:3-oxoacyl-[acyl-carrier-protein] reductase FabG [Elysia marginata]